MEKIFAAHGLTYRRTFYFPTVGEYAPMQSMADMPDADAVARQAEQTAQELHAYLK